MIDEALQDWIEKSLNETATEVESRALEERLLEDEQARDYYLNAVNLHASLRRRFAAEAESPTVVSFSAETETRRKHVPGIGLAVTACMALIVGVFALLMSSSQPIAEITQVVGAYRDSGAAYSAGELVKRGPLKISRGLVRLDFLNGARVTIEGPAEIEVVNEMHVVLHRGVVTATIPESAVGFVVDTSAAHVVDLGTSFGVSVSDDGQTDVCVFDGEVEVSSSETAPRLLREGQAIRASEHSKTIDSAPFETSRFEKAWPINSGVLQTTGSIRFVSPGPSFHPGNYKDNEHIVVFPERRGFVPKEAIRVDMVDPGQYAKSRYREKPTLLTEQRLTSYLLQLNAYPSGKNPNRRRSVRGQITFAKPIVGVITDDRLLKESEAAFRIPNVKYPSARTIEPRPEGDLRHGFDTVILAADRRTLLIELQENPGHLDQVRVLVEAE